MAEASRTIKLEILGDAKGAQQALKETADSAEKSGGSIKESLGKAFDALTGGAVEKVKGSVDGLKDNVEKNGGLIKGAFSTAFGILGSQAVTGSIEKLKDLFTDTIGVSTKSVGEFQAKLGLTAGEAQKLTNVSREVFKDNWGADLADVNEALLTTKQQFSNLNDTDLKNLTEQGLIVKQLFGAEQAESMKVASTMAKNFGIDGSQAMDLITKSFQLGGNKADDLLDTFNEYSVQFKTMGFDAKGFSNVLIEGLDKGAFNADKVADSVKEFNIRIKDGSDQTYEALQLLNIDTVDLFKGFNDGSITTKQAMEKVNDALRKTDDAMVRNQLGVMLYGTQWEDVGPDVILSLDKAQDKLGDFSGATQAAGAAVSQDFGSMWTSFTRGLQAELAPILSELIAKFMEFVPTIQQVLGQVGAVIQQVFANAQPIVESFFGWLSENGPNILAGIGDFFTSIIIPAFEQFGNIIVTNIWPAVQNLWTAFSTDLMPALQTVGEWFVSTALPVLGEFAGFILGTVVPALISLVGQFDQWLIPILGLAGEWIGANLVPAFQQIATVIATVVVPALGQVVGFLQANVLPVLNTIVSFIANVFITEWNILSTVVSTVWTAISGFISSNWNTIQGIFNVIIGVVGGAFSAIWNTLSTLVSGVWTAISTAISTAWNTIQGIFNIISSVLSGDFGAAWTGIQNLIGNAWNGIVSQIQNAWNTISGIFSGIVSFLADTFGVAWTTLQTLLETVWTGIHKAIDDAWVLIRDIFNNIKEFIETVVKGAFTGLQTSISTVWTNINQGISEFFEGVKRTFNDLVKFFSDLPGNILKALGDLGKTLWGAGQSLIQGLIDGITSIHIPTPHINVSFHDEQLGPVTVPMPSFSVSWYKNGGIFDAASIIGVGEAGPEAVLPIDKLSGILADTLDEVGFDSGGGNAQAMRQMIREELTDLLKRSQPVINQTNYGVQPEDIAIQTTKALRRHALEMGL